MMQELGLLLLAVAFLLPEGSRSLATFLIFDIFLFWLVDVGFKYFDYFYVNYFYEYIAFNSAAVLFLVFAIFIINVRSRPFNGDGYLIMLVGYAAMVAGNTVGVFNSEMRPDIMRSAMAIQAIALMVGAISGGIYSHSAKRSNSLVGFKGNQRIHG